MVKKNMTLEDYQALFDHMVSPFSYYKIVVDDSGKPVDYVFLDVNTAFEVETGCKKEDIIGKSVLEVFPETESYWIERLGQVALTGIPDTFEDYAQALNSWYEVSAYSTEKMHFAMTVKNVTGCKTYRKQIEAINENLEIKIRERTAELEEEILKKEKAECEIEQINLNLESKVQERTQELNKLNARLEKVVKLQNKMTESLKKYKLLSENANDAFLFIDMSGSIIEANETAAKLYGYTKAELSSMTIFDLRCSETAATILRQMSIADMDGIIFTSNHRHKDGTIFPVEVSSKGTTFGNRRVLLSIIRDITERKKAEENVLFLSYHDQLTGLYNRRFYEEALERLDTEENFPIALIIADINSLKLANDAFGHLMGDDILKKAALSLQQACRPDDIIARWGGDEFVILLPKTDQADVEVIIESAKKIFTSMLNSAINSSISLGWDIKYSNDKSVVEVLKTAEDMMYREKIVDNKSTRSNIVDTIIRTLNEKNPREEKHSERVSEISLMIGNALNLSSGKMNKLKTVGLMHDIGKIAIDERILNKPGMLTQYERDEIRRHPDIGYRILNAANDMANIAEIILYHHERWDGKGYPKGLKQYEIPLMSRILSIADCYDAMTSERPYRRALSEETALMEIELGAGTQFDPELAHLFVECFKASNGKTTLSHDKKAQ